MIESELANEIEDEAIGIMVAYGGLRFDANGKPYQAKQQKTGVSMSRFDYVKYDEETAQIQAAFKEIFENLTANVELIPNGRAKSLVLTKLEEAYMWIGKALRDEQVERNGKAELQEERKDG